ncbi:MAG: caspase family protein [Hyphomicrobiaceae bacterium]
MRFTIRTIFSFFLWVAIVCSQAYGAENRVALVIGNANYESITPLAKPLNDANRVAELLRSIGFVVIFGTDARKSDLQRLAGC